MTKLESLKSDLDFKRILRQKKIQTNYFTIFFGKNLNKESYKKLNIAFIMKKKIGNSVVRNKIKRRLRFAVQKNLQSEKSISNKYSYIIFGKTKAFDEKYSIIQNEINKTFNKINQKNNSNEIS